MCLSRIILITGAKDLSLISASHLTIFFVSGDVLGLLIQAASAVVMPLGILQDYHNGSKMVIVGLAVLVVYFGLFICVAGLFYYRIKRDEIGRIRKIGVDWKANLGMVFLGSALIFGRSVFGLVEYSQGNVGWLISREWKL